MPCRTVRYAVGISNPGDTILLNHTQGQPYLECEENSPITVQYSLTIRGLHGSAEIQCRRNCRLFLISPNQFDIHLNLINLTLSNSDVAVSSKTTNINLFLHECSFRNNSVGILIEQTTRCFLIVNNSRFNNHQYAGIKLIPCQTSVLRITNSLLYSSGIRQQDQKDSIREKYELLINNCSFVGKNVGTRRFRNGVLIHSRAKNTSILINNTIFTSHVGVNHNEYLLWIKDKYVETKQKTTIIVLDRLAFNDNYWKRTLIYLEAARARGYWVSLENSLFQNNTGTIELSIPPFIANEYVLNSYFPNNTILLRNNTFLHNRYFPSQGMTGIYATLFFNFGSFQVVSCRFIDNHHGRISSTGVISISDMANVTLNDCYFEYRKDGGTAIQVLAYPKSILTILGNNIFNIIELKDTKIIFIHLPSNNLASFTEKYRGSVIMAGTLKFICPQGFNATQSRIQKSGQEQNGTSAFTFFFVLCLPCPRKTYSLQRGEVTFPNNATEIISRDFKCYECPRGGHCALGYLKAKANFWGYRRGNEVRFIHCPRGYCCDGQNCPSYKTCHGQRTGILCGQCPNGTSESFFSTKCKQNSTCNASIFFPTAAFLILAYILFFLCYEDIECFSQQGFSRKLPNASAANTKESGGCIKIIFYYYQTIYLLVSNVRFEETHKYFHRVTDLISNIFNLVVADISSFDCPLPSITPVSKALISHSYGFVMLLTLGIGCFIWKICNTITRPNRIQENGSILNPLVENDWNIDNSSVNNHRVDLYHTNHSHKISFTERALGAFTHISLLMYSATATLCLTLLHCVPFKNTKLLFIDGTMKCYQPFQYVLLGYMIISILPFCMVPFIGSYVLNLGLISVTQFCLGCLLPFPFCCYWLRLLRNRAEVNTQNNPGHNTIHKNRLAILHVLSGPFRSHEAVACFPRSRLAWEGVLILRRLILILIFAFSYDGRWRTLSALVVCGHTGHTPLRQAVQKKMGKLS